MGFPEKLIQECKYMYFRMGAETRGIARPKRGVSVVRRTRDIITNPRFLYEVEFSWSAPCITCNLLNMEHSQCCVVAQHTHDDIWHVCTLREGSQDRYIDDFRPYFEACDEEPFAGTGGCRHPPHFSLGGET